MHMHVIREQGKRIEDFSVWLVSLERAAYGFLLFWKKYVDLQSLKWAYNMFI